MKAAVVVFPGSNRERDVAKAILRATGQQPAMVWHAESALPEGTDLVVLPINVDRTPDEVADARSFIDVHEPLPLYSDMKFQLPFELPGKGKMPQTVLLDRQGRIRAHFSGEADWASPEARALIDALLAEAD